MQIKWNREIFYLTIGIDFMNDLLYSVLLKVGRCRKTYPLYSSHDCQRTASIGYVFTRATHHKATLFRE